MTADLLAFPKPSGPDLVHRLLRLAVAVLQAPPFCAAPTKEGWEAWVLDTAMVQRVHASAPDEVAQILTVHRHIGYLIESMVGALEQLAPEDRAAWCLGEMHLFYRILETLTVPAALRDHPDWMALCRAVAYSIEAPPIYGVPRPAARLVLDSAERTRLLRKRARELGFSEIEGAEEGSLLFAPDKKDVAS